MTEDEIIYDLFEFEMSFKDKAVNWVSLVASKYS